MLHMKFDFDWPSGFWGEDVENVDNIHTYIHTYIQTTEAYLSYKLTTEPSAQVSENVSSFLLKQAAFVYQIVLQQN